MVERLQLHHTTADLRPRGPGGHPMCQPPSLHALPAANGSSGSASGEALALPEAGAQQSWPCLAAASAARGREGCAVAAAAMEALAEAGTCVDVAAALRPFTGQERYGLSPAQHGGAWQELRGR